MTKSHFLLAVVATLCQHSDGLALTYLGAEFSQGIVATVRDGVQDGASDLGYTTRDPSISSYSAAPSASQTFWQDRSFVGASVSRWQDCVQGTHLGKAEASSAASFQIDAFTVFAGNTSISQYAHANGYLPEYVPGYNCMGEAWANAGNMDGDNKGILIYFRVDESDGELVFNSRGAIRRWGTSSSINDSHGQNIVLYHPNGYVLGGDGSRLTAGTYAIVSFDYQISASEIYDPTASSTTYSNYVASWTFDGVFTGEQSRPYVHIIVDPEDQLPSEPIDIGGINFTFPVTSELGQTSPIFVGLPTKISSGKSTGAPVASYVVNSEFSAMTSLTVPTLPAGAEGLTIDFGSGPQSIVGGQQIDFGPTGVQDFALDGFDPLFASAELDAFVMGLQFADAGLASLVLTPSVSGDFDADGDVDGRDFLAWQRNPSIGDLADWQANYGTGATTAANASAPEPSTLLLIILAAAGSWVSRRTNR